MIGEARHRRSHLYEAAKSADGATTLFRRSRLFHNNTVRTIAPEYVWVPRADGTRLLIVAERDGDTVSAERGVYLMDLTSRVSVADLKARVAGEPQGRTRAARRTANACSRRSQPTWPRSPRRRRRRGSSRTRRRSSTSTRSTSRGPGNKLAGEYLFDAYTSFGYTPEYQWFSPRNALGGQTANVLATLKGTVNPELVYVVSSHYDSVAIGPGADDDTSGTAALLEAARIMAGHPMPATIVFASFTGEEGGLLGSREYVRQAVANKMQDRRRAQQRHDRLGQRSSARQHDPLLESRASATSSTARRCSSAT